MLTFYSPKNPEKHVSQFPQKYWIGQLFNIDNKNCFLSTKSAY